MNMLLVACGDTALLVDAGVMFPEPELFGVDLVIPDLAALDAYRGRIAALVLTHGHEDHIGAMPHVIDRVDGPVYGIAFTLALVEPKLEEHGIDVGDRLVAVAPRQTVTVGPFRIEFLRVTHSMPDCLALAISHAGRRDPSHRRLQDRPDAARRRGLRPAPVRASSAPQGVLALFSDSTNADRRGFTGSERDVIDGVRGDLQQRHRARSSSPRFRPAFTGCSCWSTWRDQFDRKVAFVGRGMQQTSQIAERLGYLRMPPGVQIRDSDVRDYPSAGRPLPVHGIAGRAAWRRCRASRSTTTATFSCAGATSWCSRPGRFPATRRRSAGS